MKKQFLLMGSLLLSSAVAFGAAFQLNLQGIRQLAMANTGTAVPWDAATIFYNPAGLTSLKRVQAYGSVQALMPKVRYTEDPSGTYIANTQDRTYTPFNLYVGGPVGYKSRFSLGLGIYTPFGSGMKWDDNWRGRYVIQEIQLQTIFYQPTVAFQVNDILSVGGGFVLGTGSLHLRKAVPLQNQTGEDGTADLKGNAMGYGYNLGVHMRANQWLQFGISYRSSVKMRVKRGYANFSVPQSLTSSFPYTAFKSDITLPQVISVGVAVRPTERLSIQLDANYNGWSSYDSLVFDYENNTSALSDTRAPRRYKNTVSVRLGGSYTISRKFTGMLGVAWDPSPVKDGFLSPDLPDNDHVMATGGLTFKATRGLTIMGVFEYVFTAPRTGVLASDNFGGRYQSKVINPGLGLTYDF